MGEPLGRFWGIRPGKVHTQLFKARNKHPPKDIYERLALRVHQLYIRRCQTHVTLGQGVRMTWAVAGGCDKTVTKNTSVEKGLVAYL